MICNDGVFQECNAFSCLPLVSQSLPALVSFHCLLFLNNSDNANQHGPLSSGSRSSNVMKLPSLSLRLWRCKGKDQNKMANEATCNGKDAVSVVLQGVAQESTLKNLKMELQRLQQYPSFPLKLIWKNILVA